MKKSFKKLLAVIFVLSVLATFYYLWSKGQRQTERYQIETINPNDTLMRKILLTGNITPRDEVAIKPQIAGIIAELMVQPGQQVEAGQIIARVDVIPEMIQMSNAEAQLAQAKLEHERLDKVHQRAEQLYKQNLISAEEYERSENDYEAARLRLASASDALSIVRKGISSRGSGESNTLVRATRTGKILSIPVRVGSSVIPANNFNEGTTIATIADMRELIFKGNADETEVGKLAVHQPMSITIGALPGVTIDAAVEYISPQGVANQGVMLFEVKGAMRITSDSIATILRSGFSANAEVTTEVASGVLSIPEACVLYRADSTFVHRVLSEEPWKTEELPVRLGLSDGQRVELLPGSPLSPTDRLRGSLIREL